MIRKISYADILNDPNWNEIESLYSQECMVKDHAPQMEIYENLERAGMLHCFGAYHGTQIQELQSTGKLVGFVSVIISIMPHNGKKMASVESIFALPEYRRYGVGDDLISSATVCARVEGCELIVYTPRIDSPFEKVVARRPNSVRTHSMFTERLK